MSIQGDPFSVYIPPFVCTNLTSHSSTAKGEEIVTILPPDEGWIRKYSPEYQLSSRVARSATSDES